MCSGAECATCLRVVPLKPRVQNQQAQQVTFSKADFLFLFGLAPRHKPHHNLYNRSGGHHGPKSSAH